MRLLAQHDLAWFSGGALLALLVAYCVVLVRERRARRRDPYAKARAAFQPPPVAPDIYAGRLVSLCLRSRTVFPYVNGEPPMQAIWRGTAAKLRADLQAADSRLSFGERREVPAAENLEHRLATMMRNGAGRVRVEVESIDAASVRTWRMTLNH